MNNDDLLPVSSRITSDGRTVTEFVCRPGRRRREPPCRYGPGDWNVTLNGIRISPDMVTAADSVEGWVDVMERNPRHEGGRILVHNGVIFRRRLYGDVVIRYRGIPLLRSEA